MGHSFVNINGYGCYEGQPNGQERHTLTVTFVLDRVPGTWDNPDDLMGWIAAHPYVDTVSLVNQSE